MNTLLKAALGLFFFFSLSAREVVVTSYNVQNLFDAVHDKGKNDWEFTPLKTPGKEGGCRKVRNAYYRRRCLRTNWDDKAVEAKIQALGSVLLRHGRPDILVLNEVENKRIFEKLNASLGYGEFFITDSPDQRGIDTVAAFAEGLRVVETAEIVVETPRPTRNILKVRFRLQNKNFLLYGHHWPAQGNPSSSRMASARAFVEDLKKEREKNPNVFVLSLGDFNVIQGEEPNALEEITQEGLVDLHQTRDGPQGTYFYKRKKTWHFLDKIFVSQNLLDGEGPDYKKDSYRIEAGDFNSEDYVVKKRGRPMVISIPARFRLRGKKGRGASDHYPVSIKLIVPPGP